MSITAKKSHVWYAVRPVTDAELLVLKRKDAEEKEKFQKTGRKTFLTSYYETTLKSLKENDFFYNWTGSIWSTAKPRFYSSAGRLNAYLEICKQNGHKGIELKSKKLSWK